MIKHHPYNDMLLEHTAGVLSPAFSLSITAHLQMCTQCRQQVRHLNHIGGELLESSSAQPPLPDAFARLMSKITTERDLAEIEPPGTKDAAATSPAEQAEHPPHKSRSKAPPANEVLPPDLPKVIRKLLPRDKPLRWSSSFPSSRVARLKTKSGRDDIRLYRIASGGRLAEHNHRGLEVTLVLSGYFSDAIGVYAPGDFLVREPGDVHRPTATQDQPCVFLSVTKAPMVPTGMFSWLADRLNPVEHT